MAFPVNSTSLVVYNGNGDIVPSQVGFRIRVWGRGLETMGKLIYFVSHGNVVLQVVPIDNSTSQVVTDALYLLHIYNPKSAADVRLCVWYTSVCGVCGVSVYGVWCVCVCTHYGVCIVYL